LSKVIKIEENTDAEARWVKYRREKLAERGDDAIFNLAHGAGAAADPAQLPEQAHDGAERTRRDAFDSGFGEGRQEGLAKGAEEVQGALSVLRNLAHSLKEQEQKLMSRIEPDAVKLAIAVAGKIIGKEVTVDREVVKRCVARAVEKILERERLVIYVHPVDLPVVMQYKEELLGTFDGIREIEVVGSENGISPGGCTVETDLLKANGKIEDQLEEILQGLLE
jgi:flagellar assembly protein FliH